MKIKATRGKILAKILPEHVQTRSGLWLARTKKEIPTKLFFAMQVEGKKDQTPGTIETDGKTFMKVTCGNGWLQITDLQIAGKKRMKVMDFLRGFQQIGEYKFV